ncbi:NADPH-dependent 2,4-dienoyl-CoA reductase, sulfur reductase [Pseudonocardia ammonioxydans]|uniref:NADPH-dependent 2,4-dienoyl-CoA reductase, sulfur reductase n=1 Tax=Pseudonocardia ammonioxydans TaxID=260086 RepID=A0A1I5FHG9_PSUAM|nr:NADPH-dependent 2,4-dienoyl-CoA reductase, sulfur reductase [Pseudonocardia ammonioxydans]
MRRIVVVGAGLAGLRAAQELRSRGFDGDLRIVGDEPHMPYNRPPLSKQVLAGDMEPENCAFPLDDLDARWMLGTPAAGLNVGGRVLRLADGYDLPYDGLVIATGRRAREWPDRPDLSGFHVLRGLDDVIALRAAVVDRPRVAIVGAGFVGCEVAATLRTRGIDDIDLIDVAPHPMPALGHTIGERATRLHAARGIRLHMNTSVERFEGTERVTAVHLDEGTRIPADLVLIALGSAPNTEWLSGSGLELCEGNVLCDARCFALGHSDIVAAGDVATWPHPRVDGAPVRVEHWTNASDMARRAAQNLLAPASAEEYAPVPTFWSDQYDAAIKAVGLWGRSEEVRILEEDLETGHLIAEGHCSDGLIGALVINRNKEFIKYRRHLGERYGPVTC